MNAVRSTEVSKSGITNTNEEMITSLGPSKDEHTGFENKVLIMAISAALVLTIVTTLAGCFLKRKKLFAFHQRYSSGKVNYDYKLLLCVKKSQIQILYHFNSHLNSTVFHKYI